MDTSSTSAVSARSASGVTCTSVSVCAWGSVMGHRFRRGSEMGGTGPPTVFPPPCPAHPSAGRVVPVRPDRYHPTSGEQRDGLTTRFPILVCLSAHNPPTFDSDQLNRCAGGQDAGRRATQTVPDQGVPP